jgi:hypothetical protein
MCILLMIPTKAAKPNEEILDQCWKCNPDGAGFMYPDKAASRLVVSKGHMDLAALKAAFALVPEGVPVSVHFRIKTHGNKDADNTHPHWVWPDEVAMSHNGILPIGAPADSAESDTARFARLVLPHLPKTWWKNPALVHLIESYMGRGNKMVVMNQAGDYKILNEEAGSWEQGVWFSNSTFRPTRASTVSSHYRHGEWTNTGWDDDSYYGGLNTTHQVGTQGGTKVASAGNTVLGNTKPATKASNAETEVLTLVDPDVPIDPLVRAIADGELTAKDRRILETDIGSMTDAEFARYEEIMETLYA